MKLYEIIWNIQSCSCSLVWNKYEKNLRRSYQQEKLEVAHTKVQSLPHPDFVKVSDLWSDSMSKNWTICKLKMRYQSSRMFRIHSQIKKQTLLYRVSSMPPFFSLVWFSPLYLLRRNDSAPYREYLRKAEFVFMLLVTWSITFLGDWS